jgi:hypothetical protein
MRTVTSVLMFLVALLTVVGIYVLREQSLGGLHRTFGALLGNQRPVARQPTPPKVGPAKSARVHSVGRKNTLPQIEVMVTVIPIEPKPTVDTIQVGMAKSSLWGEPDAMTSSREGGQFLETFIYLPVEDPSKATVVRLVNGAIVSVRSTRTVSPPLLVPQAKGRKPVSSQSDVM